MRGIKLLGKEVIPALREQPIGARHREGGDAMAAMIDATGIMVELRRAGRGAPLLVIHGELGVPGWLDSFGQLASVIAPRVPERALRLLL